MPDAAAPRTRLARRRRRRHRRPARARHRGDRRVAPAPSRWPGAPSACTQPRLRLEEKQAAAAVGQIRLAQAWTEALSAQRHHRRAAAADARRHRGPAPLPERPRDAEDAARPGCVPGHQRERHASPRPKSASATTTAWPRASPRWCRPISWCCSPTSTASTPPIPARDPAARAYPGRAGADARDRGDGRRAAARLFLRRHARPSWPPRASPPAPAAPWRSRSAMTAHPLQRRGGRARAAPGSCRRPRAARPASAGSPARWQPLGALDGRCRRGARAARGRSLLPAGVRARRGQLRARRRGGGARRRTAASWRAAFPPMPAPTRAASSATASEEIEAILGWRGRDEMIHRDDLVLV